MARFIAIDRVTGRVYGDTAHLGSEGDVVSAVAAVSLFDRQSGRAVCGFGHVDRQSLQASYDVYEIAQSGFADTTKSENEALEVIRRHGSFATALVTYNSRRRLLQARPYLRMEDAAPPVDKTGGASGGICGRLHPRRSRQPRLATP